MHGCVRLRGINNEKIGIEEGGKMLRILVEYCRSHHGTYILLVVRMKCVISPFQQAHYVLE
jgi:hypothetical protein